MEIELWWLLALPAFFALGWLASRLDARGNRRASAQLPDAYFKGLNFLLNEQPDKAIDAFVDVMRLDPETVELAFCAGQSVWSPRRNRPCDPGAPESGGPNRSAALRNASMRCSNSVRIFCALACSIGQKTHSRSSNPVLMPVQHCAIV